VCYSFQWIGGIHGDTENVWAKHHAQVISCKTNQHRVQTPAEKVVHNHNTTGTCHSVALCVLGNRV
jgi:hypothetical protein